MWILLSSRRTSPLVFDRTRNKRFMSKRLPASRLPVGTGQSMATLKEKLIKIGAKVVSRGRYVAFQMAEVAVPRNLFADILRLIAELWPPRELHHFGYRPRVNPKPSRRLAMAQPLDLDRIANPSI